MLQEVLIEELQDLLHAENQLVKALPKMAKGANNEELSSAFKEHLEQTKGHVERLKKAFELLGAKPKAKPCKGMAGLVEEGQEVITEGRKKEAAEADLALIAAAQKMEHYEISGYGTCRAIAEKLERDDVVKLLTQTINEEEKTDKLLTEIAEPILDEVEEGEEEEEMAEQQA